MTDATENRFPGFAANLSTLLRPLPFADRFAAAANLGFRSVEIQFPYELPAPLIAELLAENHLTLELFNLPPGDFAAGDRGFAAIRGAEARFAESLDLALSYAAQLNCHRLHALSGAAGPEGRATFVENIASAARKCAAAEVTLLIEPITPLTIPGYFMADFDLARAIIAEIAATGPAPKLQFDFFHCGMIHGDVVPRIRASAAITAHYQIAGTPGRQEPDRGTLDWRAAIATARQVNPGLLIGCEYTPQADPATGLGWLRSL